MHIKSENSITENSKLLKILLIFDHIISDHFELHREGFFSLTLCQTNPGFYLPAVQVF